MASSSGSVNLFLWCQSALDSAGGKPLPFTVWQMIAVGRPIVAGDLAQCAAQCADVMAVQLFHHKAEAAPLVRKRFQRQHIVSRPVALQFVVVDQRHEIIQPVLGGAHRRLPDRTFVDFAVAEQHEGAIGTSAHPRGQRKPDADRQAMAERAGRGLDARHHAVFRMAAENAVGAANPSSSDSGKNPRSASRA